MKQIDQSETQNEFKGSLCKSAVFISSEADALTRSPLLALRNAIHGKKSRVSDEAMMQWIHETWVSLQEMVHRV